MSFDVADLAEALVECREARGITCLATSRSNVRAFCCAWAVNGLR